MALTTYTVGEVLTASSLNDNFTFAAANGGKILQVVQATTVTTVATTSTSFVTSGLAATITPTSDTSKIWIVSTSANGDGGGRADMYMTLFRGTVAGTNLSATPTYGFGHFASGSAASEFVFTMNYLDSPATTSATTYTAGMRVLANTGYGQYNGAQSNMILVEVSA